MRIKMLDSEGTRVHGVAGHYRKGLEYDLPDDVALAWIDKRIAEPVAEKKARKPKTDKEE